MHHKSISAKNFLGLKPGMFSPENLSTFTVCTQVEAGSTSGVARDDVTKRFLLHKAAILTNSIDSFKHRNVKYVINVK